MSHFSHQRSLATELTTFYLENISHALTGYYLSHNYYRLCMHSMLTRDKTELNVGSRSEQGASSELMD